MEFFRALAKTRHGVILTLGSKFVIATAPRLQAPARPHRPPPLRAEVARVLHAGALLGRDWRAGPHHPAEGPPPVRHRSQSVVGHRAALEGGRPDACPQRPPGGTLCYVTKTGAPAVGKCLCRTCAAVGDINKLPHMVGDRFFLSARIALLGLLYLIRGVVNKQINKYCTGGEGRRSRPRCSLIGASVPGGGVERPAVRDDGAGPGRRDHLRASHPSACLLGGRAHQVSARKMKTTRVF
eukprot:1177154-Prorocentrum_minimum.AAC.2